MILRKVTAARWPVYRLGGVEKMFTNQRFDNWSLKQSTLEGLERLGWENATNVQRDTIPTALQGKDVIGQARTGSGKTGAFGIPIIEACEPTGKLQALVLTPTRELANQINNVICGLSKYMDIRTVLLSGGTSVSNNIFDLCWFIKCPEEEAQKRVVLRHMKAWNFTEELALARWLDNDLKNYH